LVPREISGLFKYHFRPTLKAHNFLLNGFTLLISHDCITLKGYFTLCTNESCSFKTRLFNDS